MIIPFGTSDYMTETSKRHSESADFHRSYMGNVKQSQAWNCLTPNVPETLRQTYPEYFIKIRSGFFWNVDNRQTDG